MGDTEMVPPGMTGDLGNPGHPSAKSSFISTAFDFSVTLSIISVWIHIINMCMTFSIISRVIISSDPC